MLSTLTPSQIPSCTFLCGGLEKQHSTMDRYLRLDTSDSGLRKDDDYQQNQLLTPLPSATDGRRGSIASSAQWSFKSRPSSVSSYESQGPRTPTSMEGSFPNSYHIVSSGDTSFDGMAFGPQSLSFKSSFDGIPPAAPCTPVTPTDGFGMHHDVDWSWPRSSVGPSYSVSSHAMMPAASDLGSAFESSLGFTHDPRTLSSMNSYNTTLAATELQMTMSAASTDMDFLYGTSSSDQMPFPGVTLDQIRQPFMTTIAPSDAFMQEDSSPLPPVRDVRTSFGQYGCEFSSRSPSPITRFTSPVKTEDDADYTPSRRSRASRSIIETPRGGKGVVKRNKRRSNASVLRSYDMVEYETGNVRVKHTKDIKTTESGALVASSKKIAKKQCCGFVHPDGRVCNSAFERIEHLKRHKDTHDPAKKDFDCPKCHKLFNRNDNLTEHYKTHLGYSKSGRNERWTFDQMFDLLREKKSPEIAEKAIKALIAWRASPKYRAEMAKVNAH